MEFQYHPAGSSSQQPHQVGTNICLPDPVGPFLLLAASLEDWPLYHLCQQVINSQLLAFYGCPI